MSVAIELAYWQQTVLRTVGVLVAVLIPAGTLVYVFLFKMMSFMQSRLGPMEAGPYGSMQLLAECHIDRDDGRRVGARGGAGHDHLQASP